MNDRIKNTSLLMGLTMLVFTVAAFVVASLLFLVGVPITTAHLYIALAVTAVFIWFTAKSLFPEKYPVYFGISFVASAALFIVFLLISGYFYDLSYDGQAYHQELILHLANGWNPVYSKSLGELGDPYAIWNDHYARGDEIAAAVLYAVTGKIELSKVFNLALILSSFFLAFAALTEIMPRKWGRTALLSLLVACNPVSIYQCLSFYVDGQLSSLLICLVALGVLLYLNANNYLIAALSLCIILTVNNKFTAIGYAGVLCIGLLVALYFTQKYDLLKKLVITMAASAVIGTAIFGLNPYVTNTLKFGSPFYPLAGNNAKDVTAAFTPSSFLTMNRFDQAIHSYFAMTEPNSTNKDLTQLKAPFTFTPQELQAFGTPDTAIGGFGPWFSGVLLLSLVILVMAFLFNIPRTFVAIGLLLILLISAFINYAAWWARYVPQLWMVPIIIALLGFSFKDRKVIRGLSWVMVAALFVNVSLVSVSYFNLQSQWNSNLKGQLKALKQAPQPVEAYFSYAFSNKNRLKENGIAFKEVKDSPKGGSVMELDHSGTMIRTQGMAVGETNLAKPQGQDTAASAAGKH
ncbi:hypothetical protein PP175_17650 [Aneurinibacillus sp. Ricciae_BoGa-3]|uniref:hypothetical protein n=1 Tax=Aneurinibacillus sp. Ricciae_BoGa-3 TaxID=3022697 RepID=UPI002340B585|nr:hypothetical protein [Aneurinibacillus sp. Ricciae_BoGa-3]WCK53217.1 hypothetical protein PP175_17650 [Aneurinibacillus sp. Ricciae_BoGa-3]